MRFEPIDTFDPDRQTTGPVARPRKWPLLLVAMLAIAIGVGLLVFMKDRVFRFVSGPFLILFGLLFFTLFRRLCAKRAWLLAVDSQGLSVMLRSPYRAPPDEREATVVTLAWREIAWVRPARERRVTQPSGRESSRLIETFRYLDVAVRDVDVPALAKKIDEAFETSSSWKNAHRQSTLIEASVLRLHYSGQSVSMTPSLTRLLGALEGQTTVREELRIG